MKKFPLIISADLLKVLSLIDHQIARDLISMNGTCDTLLTQTFIDINVSDSKSITFIQSNKAGEILELEDDDLENEALIKSLHLIGKENGVYTTNRSGIKLGRFLNNHFPGKYVLSATGTQSTVDIETFVNMYKSTVTRKEAFALMDIVTGDDIAKFYNRSKYKDQNEGSLGNSCMKSVNSDYFDIYSKNPNKVSMVVLYGNTAKTNIKGRALLWKLEQPAGRYFMDRIYTNDYSDQHIFIDFAKQNGWLYKSDQSIGNAIALFDPLSKTKRAEACDVMTSLRPVKHRHFPYCDTMIYYNYNTGTLSNTQKFNPLCIIQSTGGDSQELRVVWSKYHGYSINKDYARYCIIGDDYVNKDEAIRVLNTGREGKNYAVPGSDGVVEMKFMLEDKEIKKYFLKNRCVWSDYLKTWIFEDSVVPVWADVDKTISVIEHKKRLNIEYFEFEGELYIKELVNFSGIQLKKKESVK